MNAKAGSISKKILGGKVSLYRQWSSPNWNGRFYHNGVRFTTSLKTENETQAERNALQWYADTIGNLKNGTAATTKKSRSFSFCASEAIALYEGKVVDGDKSPRYVRELKILYNKLNTIIGDVDIESVDQSCWVRVRKALKAEKPNLSSKTLHQYKNAMQVCLSARVELGLMKEDDKPKFSRESKSDEKTSRTHFEDAEYSMIVAALIKRIKEAKKKKNGNHREAAQTAELRDFVVFATNTGMRIGEIRNVRFCDVSFKDEFDDRTKKIAEVLIIRNIIGKRNKRGTGICKSFFGAIRPFERRMETAGLTRDNYKQSEQLVFKEYHRDLFRTILEESGLRFTNSRPQLKRDLASLRSTYICMALRSGVPVWDVANNCRNSVQVIRDNYAAYFAIEESVHINRRSINLGDSGD